LFSGALFDPEELDGFYHRNNEYNEVSIDNRYALCDMHNGDIEEPLELGPLIEFRIWVELWFTIFHVFHLNIVISAIRQLNL